MKYLRVNFVTLALLLCNLTGCAIYHIEEGRFSLTSYNKESNTTFTKEVTYSGIKISFTLLGDDILEPITDTITELEDILVDIVKKVGVEKLAKIPGVLVKEKPISKETPSPPESQPVNIEVNVNTLSDSVQTNQLKETFTEEEIQLIKALLKQLKND